MFKFFLVAFAVLLSACNSDNFDDKCTMQNLKTDGQYYSYCDGKSFKENGIYNQSLGNGKIMTSFILYKNNKGGYDTFGGIMKNTDLIPYKKGDKATMICKLDRMAFHDCYYLEQKLSTSSTSTTSD